MAGGADVILVPERPFDVDEVCARIQRRHDAGRTFSIVVVAEGAMPQGARGPRAERATDAFGHARLGGIAVELEREIEERTGYETRMTILGHVQRGGTPTAYDRVLATRFGVAAVDAVSDGASGRWSRCTAPRSCACRSTRRCASPSCSTPRLYETAEVFFG